jgi:hypothetical protein
MNWKGFRKERGHGLKEVLTRVSSEGGRGSSARTASILEEIQTKYLLNTGLYCYCYANQTSASSFKTFVKYLPNYTMSQLRRQCENLNHLKKMKVFQTAQGKEDRTLYSGI